MLKKLILIALVAFPSISIACAEHAGHGSASAGANFAKIDVLNSPKKNDDTVKIRLSEVTNGKALPLSALKEIHTKQLHLLLIDPSMADYHHIHPVETKTKGVYEFKLSPAQFGYYRAFADITPTATGKQEYVPFVIGRENRMMPPIDKTLSTETQVDGYEFKLEFDKEPTAGEATKGKITITKDGKEFTKLESIMGAYAHIVAFSNGGHKVAHIHPMSDKPDNLEFHLTPPQGFIKIFAQVKINGKDIYAPFAIEAK